MAVQLSPISKYQYLRQLRLSAEVSQQQVAAAVTAAGSPLNQALLSFIECGRVSPSPRLAAAIQLAIAKIDLERRQRIDRVFREALGNAEVCEVQK